MLPLALSPDEKADFLVCWRQAIDKMELEFSQAAADLAQEGHWDRVGDNSPIDWMRFHCHMTSNAAADRIAVGERASEL
ncbi:MAG TPA: hypothetical protein VLK30_10165, partial [Candidatus Limnocylindrales bacterium]|nr:hypothetical protein [Candidatus Limnocylindrales bacterium]